ncbi:acyltransferase [Pedobacter sp. MC2016-14]|uniref:acyltransferase family protein n=1 Tax=Pedobacter sp. MC2016-14 TaxID=2897327 RepID=UPI001E5B10A6|nr:acyltransferase [Pedobacter sp. MC2016-14]MCD0490216.1 acyltransferase [Pedobacter sp. MC2016-14]
MQHIMDNSPKKTILRVESIDYLRGLAALSILAYHMHLFTFGEVDSSSMLGKLKIYGVSIFYILSGITLYIVYANRLYLNKSDLIGFYIKRFFRLVPLLWLATILTLIFQYNPEIMTLKKIVLNVTIIPGAIRPEGFIASGAWSIGNEIFFYLFFPFIIYLGRINKAFIYMSLLLSFVALYYFAFYILDPNVALGAQWSNYVNPLGQIFYFFTGIALGSIGGLVPRKNIITGILILVFSALFYTYQVFGEPVQLVTGLNKMILSFYITVICFLFYKFDFESFNEYLKDVLQFFGNISYSLYLLHPITYGIVGSLLGFFAIKSSIALITLTVVFSILFAWLSYVYFEKFFIKLGKKYHDKAILKFK